MSPATDAPVPAKNSSDRTREGAIKGRPPFISRTFHRTEMKQTPFDRSCLKVQYLSWGHPNSLNRLKVIGIFQIKIHVSGTLNFIYW